ncbi:PH domain-containing protein [Haloplanus aerogenes]|uniref:PH (Pleckstrin Homology) domain-containing protein n=1 Tax=Haloplanus aerogenes TaxID=660522 RepID=A0A3M0CWV1_9EURY|nr:PH domain-containing protein [Haloplanus aerogenes]AZH25078.1 PH domain-containing protein [Haloplanus aerogenes]RMB13702.1 PH (Pleckstrin Homology) domain-containing protein [Haloplanus aerogenes]
MSESTDADAESVAEMDAGDDAPPEWLSLDPGEDIVWIGRPAFETLYGTLLSGLLLTVFLIGFLILLGVPFAYLRIQNTDYVVTTESLYVKSGIFSTNIETVDLDRIQNTEYNRSFWGKQFGYGSISISTAGSSGAEISFDGIPDAPAVRDRITELQRRHSGRGDDGAGDREGERPASADQITELIEEVRATREAFERIERHLADGEASSVQPSSTDSDGTDASADTGDDPDR